VRKLPGLDDRKRG